MDQDRFNVILQKGHRDYAVRELSEAEIEGCIRDEIKFRKDVINKIFVLNEKVENSLRELIILKYKFTENQIKMLDDNGLFDCIDIKDKCSVITLDKDKALKFKIAYEDEDELRKKRGIIEKIFKSNTSKSIHHSVKSLLDDDLVMGDLLGLAKVTAWIRGLSFDLCIGIHVECGGFGNVKLTLDRFQGRSIIVDFEVLCEMMQVNRGVIVTQKDFNLRYWNKDISRVASGINNLEDLEMTLLDINSDYCRDRDFERFLLDLNLKREW